MKTQTKLIQILISRFSTLVMITGVACGLIVSGAILSPLVGVEAGSAYAQRANKDKKKRKTRRVQTLSPKVHKKLTAVQELIQENNYGEAVSALNELKAGKLTGYERAQVWSLLAYAYMSQEKYSDGLRAYGEVLKETKIPDSMRLNTYYTMAQVYMIQGRFRDTLATIDKWLKLADAPTPSAYELKVTAYYQLKDYKNAIKFGNKAFALLKAQAGVPKEQLYNLMRASYFELNDMANMGKMLEGLVVNYPKGEYFSQLSALYSERGDEQRQVAILEVGFDGGYIKKANDIVVLASILVEQGNPYKAGKILEKAMKDEVVEETVDNLKLLANAWIFAAEHKKSTIVLAKAAKKSDEGILYIQLGASYADLDNWSAAAKAIRAGIKKGGLKRKDQAYTTLGMVLFNLGQYEGAIKAFKSASKDKRSRDLAFRWIKFLEQERIRVQQLATS